MPGKVLRVGSELVPVSRAATYVRTYTTAGTATTFGYPYYDRFDLDGPSDRLTDGDLLTPTLLNAAPSLRAFRYLQELRDSLTPHLQAIQPVGLRLTESDDEDLDRLATLFDVLPLKATGGVQGTTLSKVLHRKRPHFIPLYDSKVWVMYGGKRSGRIPSDRRRSWGEFFRRLAEEIRSDICQDIETWTDLSTLKGNELSLIRTIDIVAWSWVREHQART